MDIKDDPTLIDFLDVDVREHTKVSYIKRLKQYSANSQVKHPLNLLKKLNVKKKKE